MKNLTAPLLIVIILLFTACSAGQYFTSAVLKPSAFSFGRGNAKVLVVNSFNERKLGFTNAKKNAVIKACLLSSVGQAIIRLRQLTHIEVFGINDTLLTANANTDSVAVLA
jgi:hypothetical protein